MYCEICCVSIKIYTLAHINIKKNKDHKPMTEKKKEKKKEKKREKMNEWMKSVWLGDITGKKKKKKASEQWKLNQPKRKCSYYCNFMHSHFCYESVVKIVVNITLFFSQYLYI